ncbi:MAG TPA: oxidoreductase [Gordonia polyisoprenivorans]|uniref:ferredoxin--NADP reductase n=1 Tax=Gordonia polyisoprenivorans TaxID=84595 RepID=UPI000372C156|nr:FAD-dependent oxidoreductase [Gordonia polyisoprenivorans]OZC31885.1 oxidoreductase [Gordonia polyisoprenivorans]WCB36425.1 FAD-dependent oxidoreductase [Gordonia polyisoprenivorans]HCS57104.1 oxidoreductase [Gordonia polyisoprenivorans]
MTSLSRLTSLSPRWLTMHRAVLVALLALAVVSFIVAAADSDFAYTPEQLLVSLVIALAVTGAGTYLCAALVRVPPGADSWAITALILFFLMPGVSDAASAVSMVIAAGAAAISKYVVVWRRRLILNPAVVGAIAAYAVSYAGVSIAGVPLSSPFWWVAAEPLFYPMLIIGILLVTALREWWLVTIFLLATLATVGVLQVTQGGQDLQFVFVSSPTLFLAAVMLPEPLTSPTSRIHRAVYAIIVAVLMNWQQTFEITDAYSLEFVPQIALGVGCVYAFVVRLVAQRGAGRVVLDTYVDRIAENTYRVRAQTTLPLRFAPGQWAMVSAPRWSAPLWQRTRRVFSYAEAPGENPAEFAFTVPSARVSTFKSDLIESRRSRLYLDATGGDFTLERRVGRHPLVLLAAGIGITPYRSMLRTLTLGDGRPDLSWLTVVHVVGAAERTVYDDDLDILRAAGARVEVTSDDAGLTAGIAEPAALVDLAGRAVHSGDAHYLVSGNPAFVRTTAATIRRTDTTTRWAFWRIRTDAFLGY